MPPGASSATAAASRRRSASWTADRLPGTIPRSPRRAVAPPPRAARWASSWRGPSSPLLRSDLPRIAPPLAHRILPRGLDPCRDEGERMRGCRASVADASDSGQSQIQIQPNPGFIQQSPAKLKHRKSLDFLCRIELYQGVTPTPMAFFFSCAPIPPQRRPRGSVDAAVRPCLSFFFVFIWGPPVSRSKCSPVLKSRTRGRPFRPTRRPRRLISTKKGILAFPNPRVMNRGTRGKNRPIDPMARIRLLHKKPEPVFEPWQADGRQPFMPQEYLTTPAFEDLSLSFRSCEADAAAFRRARSGTFHPATDDPNAIPVPCK